MGEKTTVLRAQMRVMGFAFLTTGQQLGFFSSSFFNFSSRDVVSCTCHSYKVQDALFTYRLKQVDG